MISLLRSVSRYGARVLNYYTVLFLVTFCCVNLFAAAEAVRAGDDPLKTLLDEGLRVVCRLSASRDLVQVKVVSAGSMNSEVNGVFVVSITGNGGEDSLIRVRSRHLVGEAEDEHISVLISKEAILSRRLRFAVYTDYKVGVGGEKPGYLSRAVPIAEMVADLERD